MVHGVKVSTKRSIMSQTETAAKKTAAKKTGAVKVKADATVQKLRKQKKQQNLLPKRSQVLLFRLQQL